MPTDLPSVPSSHADDDLYEQLRIQNERFEYVARATEDIVRDWDIVTGHLFWGESLETRFGYNKKLPTDHIDFWYKNVHPRDSDRIKASIDKALDDPDCDHWAVQYRFKTANDDYIYVSDKSYIIRNKEKKAIRAVGALHDNSSEIDYQISLYELNAKLEKRAIELAASNAELEKFAYVASHDLQEPLRMVSSFLELLKRKYAGNLDSTAEKYIEFAVDGAFRMKRLIMDLLEYSRIGSKGYATELVNFEEIIQQVEHIYKDDIQSYDIKIVKKNIPTLVVNREQMLQLFQNLIGNAIKYRKTDIPLRIEISADLISNHYQFTIADNGIGIDIKFYEKIFIIFQRLHHKEDYPGTGIGLAICKKIVNKHRGEIWVTSEHNMGSTFYFTIPDNLEIIDNEGN